MGKQEGRGGYQGLRGENGELLFNEYGFSALRNERILVVMVVQQCQCIVIRKKRSCLENLGLRRNTQKVSFETPYSGCLLKIIYLL